MVEEGRREERRDGGSGSEDSQGRYGRCGVEREGIDV